MPKRQIQTRKMGILIAAEFRPFLQNFRHQIGIVSATIARVIFYDRRQFFFFWVKFGTARRSYECGDFVEWTVGVFSRGKLSR
jgi:hypothetical protein